MERIFNNGNSQVPHGTPSDDEDTYSAFIKSMIEDAVDYEESFLGPVREQNQRYYYGLEPAIPRDDNDPDGEDIQQSEAVSTDVRDTVMSIMPSLMRTFAASNKVVIYTPTRPDGTDMAAQATDYVSHKFWDENEGFLLLHGAIKDCLTVKLGVLTWYTDFSHNVQHKEFNGLALEQVQAILVAGQEAGMEPEVIDMSPVDQNGFVDKVIFKYVQSSPQLKIEGVKPEEFRINRRARSVKDASVVGRQMVVRASEIIKQGFDYEEIWAYVGADARYSGESSLRNEGMDMYDPIGDLVDYGEYFVEIDGDGDGINEIHRIKVIGDNYDIIEDVVVNHKNFALFQSDPRPHTAIGDCPADLVLEIQDIKSNLLRGSLDSLAETLNPRTAVNETLTNLSDALSTDRGTVVRTKGNPRDAVAVLTTEFVGAHAFDMMAQIEQVRQARTGISEASKGMDPKALQSTNVMGIDAIITGAQERIELIARILAETGFKDLYTGLLNEIVENPNKSEMLEIRGKWVEFQPSLFDASMRVKVSPSFGKGSDQARLQTLMGIQQTQQAILDKYGLNNPVVGVAEYMNTMADILALSNVVDMTRYFREITPEIEQAIASTPKEPDAATLLAQSQIEANKKDVVIKTAEIDQKNAQMDMDDNFRRDKLSVDAFTTFMTIFKDIAMTESANKEVEEMNDPTR